MKKKIISGGAKKKKRRSINGVSIKISALRARTHTARTRCAHRTRRARLRAHLPATHWRTAPHYRHTRTSPPPRAHCSTALLPRRRFSALPPRAAHARTRCAHFCRAAGLHLPTRAHCRAYRAHLRAHSSSSSPLRVSSRLI